MFRALRNQRENPQARVLRIKYQAQLDKTLPLLDRHGDLKHVAFCVCVYICDFLLGWGRGDGDGRWSNLRSFVAPHHNVPHHDKASNT